MPKITWALFHRDRLSKHILSMLYWDRTKGVLHVACISSNLVDKNIEHYLNYKHRTLLKTNTIGKYNLIYEI